MRAARAQRQDADPPRPPKRTSWRPLGAYYRRLVRAWSALMRVRLRSLISTWQTERRLTLRRKDSDEDGPIDESEAADLAYWLRRELSDDPIRLPAAPSQAALEAFAAQAARIAEAEARRAMIRAGADEAKLGLKLGIDPRRIKVIDIAPTELHRAALQEWTRLNLDLVVRIPREALVGYDDFIAREVRGGIRVERLQDELIKRLGISERHAELIARDQVGKLQGQVTQATQQAAGVDSYIWRTVDDERVRGRPGGRYPRAKPSHWALDDTEHRWDQPPVCGPGTQRGHPGSSVQCRCYGDPVLPSDITA